MKKQIYIVQKYVHATSILDALKKEKDIKPDDIYLDSTFRKEPEVVLGFKK